MTTDTSRRLAGEAGITAAGRDDGARGFGEKRSRRSLFAEARAAMATISGGLLGSRSSRHLGALSTLSAVGIAGGRTAHGAGDAPPVAPAERPSGVTVQAAAHAPSRELAAKLADTVSANDFGAIADGTSHPVSEWLRGGARDRGYRDLAALRAAYPHVTAPTDEIDWAAIQAAVDHRKSRGGGDVHLPAGSYVLNRAIRLPLSAAETNARQPKVNLLGVGENIVELRVKGSQSGPAEFGATAADVTDSIDTLKCMITWDWGSNPEGADDDYGKRCPCVISGFSMRGPLMFQGSSEGATSPFSYLCGIRVIDHVRLERLRLSGFYAALVVDGGQTIHKLVGAEGFYGAVLGRNFAHHSDMSWEKCGFSGTRAAWFLKPPAALMGTVFTSCFFSGQYGFEKVWRREAAHGDHKDVTLRTVTFVGGQFETIGASLLWTRDAQGGTRRGKMSYVKFINVALRKRAPAAGLDAVALIDIEVMDHCSWEASPDFGHEFSAPHLLACRSIAGCVVRDADEFVAYLNAAGKSLATGLTDGAVTMSFESGAWSGYAFQNSTAGGSLAPAAGDVVEQYFNRVTSFQGRSRPLGIAMTAGEAGSDRPVVVATRAAAVAANLAPAQTTVPELGAWLKPAGASAAGKLVLADGPLDQGAICQAWFSKSYAIDDPTIPVRLG